MLPSNVGSKCLQAAVPVVESCSATGARGCSPRIVKAHGGARTTLDIEFGRCLDKNGVYSPGVASSFFEHALSALSNYKNWTEVTQWQTIDEFTILCRLVSLGDSCVVIRNSYPSHRKKINVQYHRRSVESESILLSAPVTNPSATVDQMSDSITNAFTLSDSETCLAPGIRQVMNLTRKVNAIQHGCVHEANRPTTNMHFQKSNQPRAGAGAGAGCNANTGPPASAVAYDIEPPDLRMRAIRDITLNPKTLKDLLEPAKSTLMIVKTFHQGSALRCDRPSWKYELSLNWCGRGVTQAERRQRTQPPRCCITISVVNALELMLSGHMTAARLAAVVLQKASELQRMCLSLCTSPKLFAVFAPANYEVPADHEDNKSNECELTAVEPTQPRVGTYATAGVAKVPTTYVWVPL